MEKNFALFLLTLLAVALSIWNTYSINVSKSDINGMQLPSAIPMTDNPIDENKFQVPDIESLLNKLEHQGGFLTIKDYDKLLNRINELERDVRSQQTTIDKLSKKGTDTSYPTSYTRRSNIKSVTPHVTARIRVDNRYANDNIPLPNINYPINGVVVVKICINQIGMVGSVDIVTSDTDISDEDVLYSCKEAALKTHFAFNPEAPETSIGTITYIFN